MATAKVGGGGGGGRTVMVVGGDGFGFFIFLFFRKLNNKMLKIRFELNRCT